MKDKYNELIIGSGGLSGLSYLGSLEILDEYYPIKNIELPDCLIKYIMLYLKPTIKQYYDVRDLYKKYKKL